MAQVNLPMTLSVAYWDKQKSALAKVAKPPVTKLPDELKQLAKLHLAVDWKAFEADKSADADDVKDTIRALDDAVKGSIKTLSAQAQAIETSATKYETEAKKDKAFPKEVLTTVAAILKAAKEYRADVDAAVDSARKALTDKAKDAAADQKKGGGAPDPKQVKLAKGRLLTAIALLAKPGGAPKPMRFMIVQGKKTTGLALAYAVGPAQEKLLKGLMPGETPYKVMKDLKAQVVWENKALTFVSDKLALSVVKKIQAWLKKQFKLSPKMRVRNSKGTVEELSGGEDMTEALAKGSAADADTGLTVAEVSSRLGDVQADIKQGLAGPDKAAVKALLDSIMKLLKEGKADAADEALDEMEALLQGDDGGGDDVLDEGEDEDEGAEAEAPAPSSEQAAAPMPQAEGGNREAFVKRLATLQPQIKQGLGGDAAERVKQLVDGVMKLAKAERYGDAGTMLDALEKLLKGGAARPEVPAPEQPARQTDDPAAAFNARLAAVVPKVNALKARGHAALKDIALKVSEAGALARKKDLVAAAKLLDEAERLLASANDESERGESQTDEEGGGARLGEQDFKKQWPAVKASWQDAIDTVNGQISKLQAALKKTGDAELIEIAEFGLNGVTGNLKTPMMAAIMELDHASGPALKTAAGKATKIARAFNAYLASEETVAVTDDNEFGVQVTIRASLGGALRQIETLTAQLR